MGTRIASAADPGHADNWNGGFYELSIKLGNHDDARLEAALRALWQGAGLDSPFRRSPEPDGAGPAEVSAAALLFAPLRSIARIPEIGSVLCSVHVIREQTELDGKTVCGADWLDLSLPLGSLANLDARVGGFPFDGGDSRGWRTPIEAWFERVAKAVFVACPYGHAVTGFEISSTEPEEARDGSAGLFLPTELGELEYSPITHW